MKNIKNYKCFLNESIKYLSSGELINWLKERQDRTFIAIDTETTGLRGPRKDQLTQISAVAFTFNFDTLTFDEIDHYNERIKLTDKIKGELDLPDSRIRQVFKFTRYGKGGGKFTEEQIALNNLKDFIDGFGDVVLLVQNAPFDIPMINIRRELGGINKEIFDTKDFFAYFLLPTLQALSGKDTEAKRILDVIGRTKSGLPTSSLPKVSLGLGIDPSEAHDALFDCRYMVKTLEKALDVVYKNSLVDRRSYIIPRISTDRYIKAKNKLERS